MKMEKVSFKRITEHLFEPVELLFFIEWKIENNKNLTLQSLKEYNYNMHKKVFSYALRFNYIIV